jgi:hypothetical protein
MTFRASRFSPACSAFGLSGGGMRFTLALLAASLASCGGGPWDESERESEAATSSFTAPTAPYNPNGTLVLIYEAPSAKAPAAPAK